VMGLAGLASSVVVEKAGFAWEVVILLMMI
jgi:hypothetical protein